MTPNVLYQERYIECPRCDFKYVSLIDMAVHFGRIHGSYNEFKKYLKKLINRKEVRK